MRRVGADGEADLFEQFAAQCGEGRLAALDPPARGGPHDVRNREPAQQDTVVFVQDDGTRRVPQVLAEVRASQPLLKAVMIDSGDTLVDEATEIRDADGYVVEAALIPGAIEMVQRLTAEGYRLVLVADGYKQSFDNVLGFHGVRPHLEAEIISEIIGYQKPHQSMFDAALAAFDIDAADADSVVMIGNHLSRDVSGANRRGIISIWQSWSPRREKQATAPDEVPDYVVRTPGEIPALLEFIELTMARQATHRAMSALAPVSITG